MSEQAASIDTPAAAPAMPAADPQPATALSADPAPIASPEPASPAPQAPAADPAPANEPPANMPDNWRNLMAGEDDKALKQLERYKTPADMAAALVEAKQKIREGTNEKLPENPTDEQIAAYREQNGIPAEASGYELTMNDGLVIGEHDKPIVDSVLEAMHGANASPEAVNAAVNAYYTMQEQQYSDRELKDSTDQSAAIASLKDTWGADYHANNNAVMSLLNTAPDAVRDELQSARMPNGDAVFNSPEVMDWLAGISRKANPAATVMPHSNNPVQGMNDEIAHIEKLMKTNSAEYWGDSKMQDRYRELLSAQENMR